MLNPFTDKTNMFLEAVGILYIINFRYKVHNIGETEDRNDSYTKV